MTFIAVLLSPLRVSAQQQIYFDHFNVEKGLSQNSVLTIIQDKEGFMWFGTQYGLNRYDGYRFKIYRNTGLKNAISANEINYLFNDHEQNLWVATSNGLNKYNPEKDAFEKIVINSSKKWSGSHVITCIYEDRKSNLWIGSINGLTKMVKNPPYKSELFLKSGLNGLASNEIKAISEDDSGKIWVGTTKGLTVIDQINGHYAFKTYQADGKPGSLADNYITTIVTDKQHRMWVGTQSGGFSTFNKKTNAFVNYNNGKNGAVNDNIRKMIFDNKGNLWIGSLEGLMIMNPSTGKISSIKHDTENRKSLSQNSVYSLFMDKANAIWVGTYFGGVNVTYPTTTVFNNFQNGHINPAFSDNVVSSVLEENGGKNLWIGTEGGGLNFYEKSSNKNTLYKNIQNNSSSLGSNLIKVLLKDKDENLWIGTHGGGLNYLARGSNVFKRFLYNAEDQIATSREIPALAEDEEGIIWVGTQNGLYKSNELKNIFTRYNVKTASGIIEKPSIKCLLNDAEDNLWMGTTSELYMKPKGQDRFAPVLQRIKNIRPKIKYINTIAQDSKKQIWIGSYYGGLYCYRPQNNTIEIFTEENGLPSNNIQAILEDDGHNLWISTSNGLSVYNPGTRHFKNYNTSDGLLNNVFNKNARLKSVNGALYFGGYNGLTSFYPNNIQSNNVASPVVFTDLKLFNKSISVDDESGLLKADINFTNKLVLAYDQNTLTIEFALLNFIKSGKNHFAYKLDGYDKNWNTVSVPAATYTNLPSGSYIFLVKGINNDGVYSVNIRRIEIVVNPPFYGTWWAYLFYFCVAAAILVIIIRYLLIRAIFKKEKEINEHKLEFFTNISHEIRTPLTLIVGPLEDLIETEKDNPQLYRSLQPIKNNADRLMNLVTELLDFRKAESGKMPLHVGSGNIVKFCREIFMAFQNMAISKQIEYNFEADKEEIQLYFDKVQLEKVFFNLLSNAFKFTPKEGKINFKIEESDHLVTIKICDNGPGIPLAEQENLFKRFYQAKSASTIGTGLGLSFSKSILDLHHGNITFENIPQKADASGLTCFKVSLKTGKSHFKESDFITDDVYDHDEARYGNFLTNAVDNERAGENLVLTEEQNYHVLLVEDNDDVRSFLKKSLEAKYHIHESENGLKGLEKAFEIIPDIIISDVMMPVLDGLELCRRLKTDERTSHIPIVLLTARSAYVHQVNGLENGADSYIMKPFNLKILQLHIQNLLNAREKIKQKFAGIIQLEPKNLLVNTTEQNFLHKIIQIIETKMTDPDFDVPMLSSEIGMSQPTLYKKIRALTDLSVNEFIKSIRLKRAAQLLKQKIGNISDVAYAVGYTDRKYFSIEFKKYFGKSPTEFIQDEL